MLFADKLNSDSRKSELAQVFKAPFENRSLPPERTNRLLLFKFASPDMQALAKPAEELDQSAA